jgi:hypothetical protein
MLSQRHNLTALMSLLGQWIDKAHHHKPLRELILDMGSSVKKIPENSPSVSRAGGGRC